MTKNERTAMQKHMNLMTEVKAEKDKAFDELKRLNKEEGTGTAWCSAESNYKDLLSCDKDYTNIYEQYIGACAKEDLLRTFGQALASVDFWKN